MFSGLRKEPKSSSKFKWDWHADSSLSAGLLKDDSPEIELSAYGRIPSPGSDSPSGLLNGESSSVEPISDLDLFFERIYNYYCEKGLWCIIIKWIVELLSVGFTISFSAIFLLFVNWTGLRHAKCGMDAVESGIKPCDLEKEAFNWHPLTPLTPGKSIIVGYLGLFSIYWAFCFFRFFAQLKDVLAIRHFYYNSIHVSDSEIQTMPWATVLEKVVELQYSQKLCVVKDLSAHDIVMRLMRKENYLIGMVNKGILAFEIPSWIPGTGPTLNDDKARQKRLFLTKTLEWILNWCILQSMFDRNFCVRKDFITNPRALKRRLILVGFTMLVLNPFLVIFMLVYLFLRHAEQFFNHPRTASSRRWSNLSRWIFREFNEVDHLFRHRINSSALHASDYLNQFPSPIVSIIAKFISFVSGGFTAVFLIIGVLEESLLEGHIFGRQLFWYGALFGAITAISRAAISNELLILDPEGAMSMVVQHTHYMPKRWRGKVSSEVVRMEFETLFQYTGMLLLEEMTSIFLTPFFLMFVIPERVNDILQFISDYTVHVEGVGDVCSFSVFDFQNHGNSKYGSPHTSSRGQRSSQGKMEKSFLSFQNSYPSWEPDPQGKQFISNVCAFRDRMLLGNGGRPSYLPPPNTWWACPDLRGYADRNSFYSREIKQEGLRTGNHLGTLWLNDIHQRNHPYLLDWYYTTHGSRDGYAATHDVENPAVDATPELHQGDDFWIPPHFGQNEANFDDLWGRGDSTMDRSQSHLGASTSHPPVVFRDSVFQKHESRNLGRAGGSHWWARAAPNPAQGQTSFIEPPGFGEFGGGAHTSCYYENRSDKSIDERQYGEEHLDWRLPPGPSLPIYSEDDIEAGDVSLHFDGIYSKAPETPRRIDLENDKSGW